MNPILSAMPVSEDSALSPALDSGLAAVPISAEETQANLPVCVIVRRTVDPASGHFVILERFPGGRIVLGALCDASGEVVEWLELWLQEFAGPETDGLGWLQNNAANDDRWTLLAASLRRMDRGMYLALRAAVSAPRPTFIDLASLQPCHPTWQGAAVEVCLDDRRLATAGLPVYGLGRRRYGWTSQQPAGGPLIALTAGTPAAEGVIPLADCLPAAPAKIAAFNPAGGRVLARRFAPLGLVEFGSILAGRAWSGVVNARRPFKLGGIYQSLEDASLVRSAGRHFFSSREGQAGRAVETLHLKLLLIQQCARLVRVEVERSQLPLLNLSAESFRVRLGATGDNLPFCWTARASLARFGQAIPLSVPTSRMRYFKTLEALSGSIYRPEELAIPKKGHCGFRITKVLPRVEDGVVIEATLITQQRIELNEMLEFTLPLLEGCVTLFGMIDPSLARATGEAHFRGIPLQFTPAHAAALEAVAGVAYSHVPFSVLLPLNAPCDLFALGVIALEILFAGSEITLPVALDACFSLASELAERANPDAELGEAVGALFAEDPARFDVLGSRHICHYPTQGKAGELDALIPPELWHRVLATIVRFFPGRSPFSYCRDFNDAPSLALQSVFDPALRDLDALCGRSYSLHTMDWAQNLELAEAIQSVGP